MPKNVSRSAGVLAVLALLWASGCSTETQPEAESVTENYNRVDVMFAQMMVPHHADAIAMADYLQGVRGVDPRVQGLAEGIVTSQQRENEEMNTWLSERGYPQVDDGAMRVDEEAVAGQSAEAAQEQFLSEMIAHHEHGVDMAASAARRGQSPTMTDLAAGMVQDQTQEIQQMRQLLADD